MPRQNLLYNNVYHALCARIFTGEFPPGSRLPSMYDLAQSYNASPDAIRATFKMMQDIGLIHVFRGKEASVLYDADNPASQRAFHEWLANRSYTLSEVYNLTAQMASTTAAFGASRIDEAGLAKLDEIARRVETPGLPINRLALSLVDYYFTLVQPLHNDRLEDLMRACDAALSSAMLLAAQDSALGARLADMLRQIILELHGYVHGGAYDQIASQIPRCAYEIRNFIFGHIDALTDGLPAENGLHFDWTVSSNEDLYSEIANDLIFRICTGEFLDGDYLPSELKLQKEYATSSKSIRNALLALNDCGIVRTVNGLGTLVTYLSPTLDPDPPAANPQKAYLFFNALQLIMLNMPDLVQAAFIGLTDQEIQLTHARVKRLLDSKDCRFYSYVGILLNIPIQNSPHELTRQIFRQLQTLLFLLCHKRQYFADIFLTHLDQSMPFITGALDALQARDAGEYSRNLHEILKLVAQSTLQLCAASGLHCDVVLPQ